MSASDWTELWERFHRALALPPDERDAWLDAHCTDPAVRAELDALLEAAGRSGTPLDRPAAAVEPLEPGTRIGPWAVVDLLGRGGMGEVYRVERADGRFEKRAALKLLAASLGDDAFRARFERERRILAGLDHPNIARLIDAGRADDGRPWLLMELVDGRPITEVCRDESWPLARRLRAFVQACDAVAYAHRRLIVHRDLKPANLLVDADGRTMLLDFGIARLLENTGDPALTRAGQAVPNTPGYASPEQLVRDETGTAVDVYALGLLLYELCTGQRPFAEADPGADALDQRRRPPEPTAVEASLQRELDWIVARACAFRPDERYPGVDALAADVQSVLDNRPPRARATGPLYRAGKFVRRNWPSVSAASAVGLVIVALAVGLVREGARTRAALVETDRQREQAEATAGFLRELFVRSDATRNDGVELTAGELLARGRERLARRDDLDPLLHADLLRTLSDVHRNLGDYGTAQALASESLARLADGPQRDRAAGWLRVGRALFAAGRPADARTALGRGLALVENGGADPGAVDSLVIDLLHARGAAAQFDGDLEAAGADFRAAEARLDALPASDPERRSENRIRLGSWHWMHGRLDLARTAYADAVRWQRQRRAISAPELARALDAEASALLALGRAQDAAAGFEETVAIRRRVLGDAHPLTARSLSHLGAARYESGRIESARSALIESLAVLERAGADDGPQAAGALNNLGLVERASGRLGAARAAFERALAINRSTLGNEHLNVANNLNNLGLIAEDDRQWSLALARYDDAERIIRAVKGDDHADRAFQQTNRGRVLLMLGELQRAKQELDDALDVRESALGPAHPRTLETLFWAGLEACLAGRSDEGLPRLGRVVEHDPPGIDRARLAHAACGGAPANGDSRTNDDRQGGKGLDHDSASGDGPAAVLIERLIERRAAAGWAAE